MLSPQYYPAKLDGIVIDLPPEELDDNTWSSGQNIHFKDLATERSGGYEEYGPGISPTQNPEYLLPVLTSDIAYWIYATRTMIFVTDGSSTFDITPVAGVTASDPGSWTGGLLNGIPFLNNGVDIPVYWDLQTGNAMLPLPGWDPTWTCRALRAAQYHLFAINMTINSVNFPELVHWSDAADPGTIPQEWAPTPSNEAGNVQLAATPGFCIDGGKLRDQFVVYKSESTYLMTYVAGQYVFTVRPLFINSGIQATNCWVEARGYHYVFTEDDVIRHDGNSLESIVNYKVRRTLNDAINPDLYNLSCLALRSSTDEVWVCISMVDEPALNKAFVINTLTGKIGIRDLPLIYHLAAGIIPEYTGAILDWDSDSQAWDNDTTFWSESNYSETADGYLMAAYPAEKLYWVDRIDSNDGEPLVSYVERTGLMLQDTVTEQFYTQLWPRITGQEGDIVTIRCGGQSHFDEPISWNDPQPYIIGTTKFIPIQVNQRYVAVNFSSVGGNVWRLHGFTTAATPQGLY